MTKKNTDTLFRARYVEAEIAKYLAEDGIEVNIDGLDDTVKKYFRHEDYMVDDIFELMTELNLWTDYFYGLSGLLALKKDAYLLQMDIIKSKFDGEKIDETSKNEISQLNNRVKQIRLFEKNIQKYTKFLSMAFYACRRTYTKSMKYLIFKTIT